MEFDDKFAERLDYVCDCLNTQAFYLNDIPNEMKLLLKIHRQIPDFDMFPSLKLDWTKEQMQACALAFYKDLDMDFYFTIKERFCDVENSIEIDAPQEGWHGKSSVGFGKTFKGLKIQIKPQDNVYGLLTFVHEFAHLLPIRAKKRVPAKLCFITEIESHFCELAFLDYLYENGILDEKELKNELHQYWLSFKADVGLMLQENHLFKKYNLSCPVTKEMLNKIQQDSKPDKNHKVLMKRLEIMANGREDGRVENGVYAYKYVFGKLVANALFEDFKKDKKATLKRFKKFLKKSNDYEPSPKGRDDVLNDLLVGGKERLLQDVDEIVK